MPFCKFDMRHGDLSSRAPRITPGGYMPHVYRFCMATGKQRYIKTGASVPKDGLPTLSGLCNS